MRDVHRVSRCLAVAIFIPGVISGAIAVWHAVPEVFTVWFSWNTTFISPTGTEIVRDAMLTLVQPAALLATAVALWLLTDIAEAVCREEESPARKESAVGKNRIWPD